MDDPYLPPKIRTGLLQDGSTPSLEIPARCQLGSDPRIDPGDLRDGHGTTDRCCRSVRRATDHLRLPRTLGLGLHPVSMLEGIAPPEAMGKVDRGNRVGDRADCTPSGDGSVLVNRVALARRDALPASHFFLCRRDALHAIHSAIERLLLAHLITLKRIPSTVTGEV